MEPTQTESTKELDNLFDFGLYPLLISKSIRRTIRHKAVCNQCNSNDCFIYESIEGGVGPA